jgi:hypothetical protein
MLGDTLYYCSIEDPKLCIKVPVPTSVGDPEPDPDQDPRVFGTHGS